MRPRILFLSQSLPYPPHSGVTNRTYNILRQLQGEFDVTLLAFSRRNHQADMEARALAVAHLSEELTHVGDAVPIGSDSSSWQKLWCHARSLLASRPYTYFEYESSAFRHQLRNEINRAAPDLIHLDSLDLHRWLADIPEGLPVACTHHNIESELLRLRAERVRPRALGAYMNLQARRLEATEKRLCPRFAMNVMMSDLDGDRLRALAPGSRTLTVPNGVDTEFFRPPDIDGAVDGRVIFLGPTYMFPNQDGMNFFIERIWPIVRRAVPGASLELIGKNGPGDRERYEASPGVTCRGYVADIRPHMVAASCSIVPLRVGGGTRLKILDAWAMGKAVVSTTIGAEGLETRDGQSILLRDDPLEFADAVIRVLRDPALRVQLEHNARRTVCDIYGWDRIGSHLRRAYFGLIPARHAP